MTTHDQHIATETAVSAAQEVPPPREVSAAHSEQPVDAGDDMTTHDQHIANETAVPAAEEVRIQPSEPPVNVEPVEADTVAPAQTDHPADDGETLFAVDPAGLRTRWDDIQAAFVDDPSGCVQQADGLVDEVIQQLTSQFADTRSHLEAQWARGESASTEDLRVALTRYREFFQRLLAV